MNWGIVRSIILLPGNVLVIIPFVLSVLTSNTEYAIQISNIYQVFFWLGILALIPGLLLIISTVRIFIRFGDGTPAPWDPPKNFVIRGPYQHARNPMISGVILLLFAQSMLLRSIPIGVWTILFAAGNFLYIPLVEEKDLKKRFGESYMEYQANVPRWIPRLSLWNEP